jgi:hypothetical protein
MYQNFQAGDFLIFQLESGYGLLRILAIDDPEGETVWHLSAYNELFMDIETADAALENPYGNLSVNIPHVALTNRAFEATQVARMKNEPLTENDIRPLDAWRTTNGEISDRSIRLMLGLR